MSPKKASLLTPLQLEAQRIEEEKVRRQEALKAAQQFALRQALERKQKNANAESSAAPTEEEESKPVDFDVVREALKNERHREAQRGNKS